MTQPTWNILVWIFSHDGCLKPEKTNALNNTPQEAYAKTDPVSINPNAQIKKSF